MPYTCTTPPPAEDFTDAEASSPSHDNVEAPEAESYSCTVEGEARCTEAGVIRTTEAGVIRGTEALL